MSEVTPQPTPPVQQDHFFRNLAVVILLGVIGFVGFKAYESVQDSNDFHQQQQEDFGRALRGD